MFYLSVSCRLQTCFKYITYEYKYEYKYTWSEYKYKYKYSTLKYKYLRLKYLYEYFSRVPSTTYSYNNLKNSIFLTKI